MIGSGSTDTRSVTLVVGALATAVAVLGSGNVFTLWDTIVGVTLICLLFAARPFATLPTALHWGAALLLALCATVTVGAAVDFGLGLVGYSGQSSSGRGPFNGRDTVFFVLWVVLAGCTKRLLPWLDRVRSDAV